MICRFWRGLTLSVCALLVPVAAFAQASIAGVVRDTSGAVLPGVTVEASSPALIEKVRSAVTDGSGQYRIVSLDPGTYSVTFTLTGFTGFRREGIELTGAFVATVNADLKVGTVQETITVTGETPLVDVQSSRTQQTLRQDVINAIPTGRTYFGLASLVPGITTSVQDVGGISGPATVTFSIHGGPLTEGRLQVDGMSIGSSQGGSGVSYYVADVGHAQEIVFMSIIPSTGANTIKGSFFVNAANSAMQGSNYTQALKDQGLRAPQQLIKLWDVNGSFGGPIFKDRLWYYVAARRQGNDRYVTGMFYNQNAGNPDAWTYVADQNRQAINSGLWTNGSARMTVQPTARNKFNLFWDEQTFCLDCVLGGNPTTSPEAASTTWGHPTRVQQITWTSPASTRVLLEAGFGTYLSHFGGPERSDNPRDLVRVNEQAGAIPGLTYRSQDGANSHTGNHNWRASISYVTGQHNFKVGYTGAFISYWSTPFTNTQRLLFRVNNGTPNQLTMSSGTYDLFANVQMSAFYVQDQSTFGRLTLQAAARYDGASSQFLDQHIGPDRWIPTLVSLPAQDGVTGYRDLTPRLGAAYDLFGNGKTAVKANLGKYMDPASHTGVYSGTNPLNRIVLTTTRSWTDANRNFAPDCNLLNPAAQDLRPTGGDFCAAMASPTFGTDILTNTYDPEILGGWNVRQNNWTFGVSLQHELLPRLSLLASYNRRWFQNFLVTDNLAVTASDFTSFSVTAPPDSRLPGGGGYVVSGLYDVNPLLFGQTRNFITRASNYGNQISYWHGVDVTLNSRLADGLTLQGGFSTGRPVTDSCEVRVKLPETNPLNPYCHFADAFKMQMKWLGTYTIPKALVQVSATFQSVPGTSLAANYAAPNAAIAPSLGRNLSGNLANATVNLIEPGSQYGDRINQLDFRAGKVFRFGRTRTQISLDLYNLLNVDAVQSYNQTFVANGSWLLPTGILAARFAKITGQIDF
jgi:Carboxypeptidase regulatory-like domain